MSNMKKVVLLGVLLIVIGSTSVAFAANGFSSPAEVLAVLTGKNVEEVTEQRIETGETYGTLANESGLLTEFREEMLSVKKDILEERVAEGTITEEEAKQILSIIEENIANCDGTGYNQGENRLYFGFGNGDGISHRRNQRNLNTN